MSTLKLSLVGLSSRLAIVVAIVINALLLARFLGPQDYGTYVIFIRIISVLTMVGDFGISPSANAFISRHGEWTIQIHRILLRFLSVSWIVISIISASILWLAGQRLLNYFPWKLTCLAIGALPMSLYTNLWYSLMIGTGQIWRLNLVRLLNGYLSLALTTIFVVALSGKARTAVVIYLIAMAVQFVAMIVMAFRLGKGRVEGKLPEELPQQILRFGLRASLGTILNVSWIYYIPVFFLNTMGGAAAVGVFSVGQQIVEKVLLPIEAMQDAIYKKMAVLSNHAAILTMNRYLRVTGWGMVVIALVGIGLAQWLIKLVLGPAFAGTVPVCRVLLLGVAFMSSLRFLSTYFMNQLRRSGLTTILAGANVLISLTFAITLIAREGAIGAAWTLTLTQILGALIALTCYLVITRSSVLELIRINRDDMTLMRTQMGALLWQK
jgi:O-antigen/teichoic acid export membrane protein